MLPFFTVSLENNFVLFAATFHIWNFYIVCLCQMWLVLFMQQRISLMLMRITNCVLQLRLCYWTVTRQGTYKMRNETRNEIYRNETKQNQTKRNSPKPNEFYRNETKSMQNEINRNEIDRNETKRYNTKWNKTYFNETISWGKTKIKWKK